MLISTRTVAVCLAATEASAAITKAAKFTAQHREASIWCCMVKPSLNGEESQPSIEKRFEMLFYDKTSICYSNATLTMS